VISTAKGDLEKEALRAVASINILQRRLQQKVMLT